jgi:two-component system chemotaxis response regulator CheB
MKKIRVLIVEDSRVVREFLEYIISQDPRLTVAAAVDSGEEALRVLDRVAPDVISMDIRLPGMNGFDATRRIMAERPTPIVIVSASVEAEDLKISMNALRAGALTILEKPVAMTHDAYEALAGRLCTQLVIMSQVKVVRQRTKRNLGSSDDPHTKASVPITSFPWQSSRDFKMLGVVASTGGPSALVTLFGGLGADFALPILLVQHITASFLEGFVAWLNTVLPQTAVIATNGDIPKPGQIYLAPPDHHLKIEGERLRIDHSELVCTQRPSGTVLFRSMAQSLGPRALGVLLTGMGADGAEGLLAIKQAGGYTFAEDASTAVVYGMPAVAVELDAVCELLPLHEIAAKIKTKIRQKSQPSNA